METIKGIVDGVNNKGSRYGIKIGEIWYNGFNDSPAKKGDNVEIEFEISGQWKNIKKVTILNAPNKVEENSKGKQASVILSYAKDMAVGGIIDKEQIEDASKALVRVYKVILAELDNETTTEVQTESEIPVQKM